MQTPEKLQNSENIQRLHWPPMQEAEPCYFSHVHVLDKDIPNNVVQRGHFSIGGNIQEFFTLDSSLTTALYMGYDSPSGGSVSSKQSPLSPQGSHSYVWDSHHSPDNTQGSQVSGSSVIDDGNELKQRLNEIEELLSMPDFVTTNRSGCSFRTGTQFRSSTEKWNKVEEIIPRLDLRKLLVTCARAVAENDIVNSTGLMEVLSLMVSVSGEPIQRLGAYMLEGLRARLECSGSTIYKALKCKEPTSSELLTYMHVLYQICPYWKFAYTSANIVIEEGMKHEPEIHIIDFQIAQGSQWVPLIQALAARPNKPRHVCITGIDDAQSAHARGGGLDIVGTSLSHLAESCGVAFEFHGIGKPYSEINLEDLKLQQGSAIAVNFPFILHHIPDESVTTSNHRDRILRLARSLSPKVVTLVEQESNTNTTPFHRRFLEAMDYYTAMFESIDVTRPRDDKQRISAEQHCVARDIVNLIACEGAERVERHELLGKWRSRLTMAGFNQCWLSSSTTNATSDMLKDYNENYGLKEKQGTLYLYWKNRAMATSSAWRT